MLGNQKIGTRLALCFGAIVALMLVRSALSYQRVRAVSAWMAQEKSIRADILQPLYEVCEALAQTGIAARNAYIYTDDADARRALALVGQYKQRYLDGLAKLAPQLKDSPTFRTV